jgi:hypothetical protein
VTLFPGNDTIHEANVHQLRVTDRVVVIRFGSNSDPDCMVQDSVLEKIADKVKGGTRHSIPEMRALG